MQFWKITKALSVVTILLTHLIGPTSTWAAVAPIAQFLPNGKVKLLLDKPLNASLDR